MAFCLPKFESEKFIAALRGGKIVPEKLMDMSSAERRTYFESIVGKENALDVNTLFEAKLLLKDQKRGLVSWAKQVSGLKEATRKDILTKIEKMEKVLSPESERAFLNDLAAKKLGTEVTFEEAQSITKLSSEALKAKDAIREDSPIRSPERTEYGTYIAKLQDLVDALKLKDETIWKKLKEEPIVTTAGTVKSIRASMDVSFTLRQGMKILATHPSIWIRPFLKQWGDIVKALKGQDPLLAVRADIASRPNALNGKYQAGKYDLGTIVEEPFPTAIPARIPILGRLYKASEAAYTGFALRTRADLADMYIAKAEAFGLDTKSPQAVAVGRIVNSMTGRGHIPLAGEGALKTANVLFFSVRFWKSNYDALSMHSLGWGVPKTGRTVKFLGVKQDISRAFVRKEAAINLSKIVLTTAATLWLAKQLGFSVELRSQSTKVGQVCVPGDICYDVSGGMRGLVTLAARILTGYYLTSKGKKVDLYGNKFGQMDGVDILLNHGLGKLSPSAGLIRDLLKGHDFSGQPITPINALISQTTPIIFEQWLQMKDSNEQADVIAALIMEALGVGVTQYK